MLVGAHTAVAPALAVLLGVGVNQRLRAHIFCFVQKSIHTTQEMCTIVLGYLIQRRRNGNNARLVPGTEQRDRQSLGTRPRVHARPHSKMETQDERLACYRSTKASVVRCKSFYRICTPNNQHIKHRCTNSRAKVNHISWTVRDRYVEACTTSSRSQAP